MNPNYKRLIRDIIIAVLSAILTFLSSCSVTYIKGDDNNPVIEHHSKVSADSTEFVKLRFNALP